MVQKVNKIWLDGKYIPWDQAQVHILTHTLHYGLGCFEGIRCYLCQDGGSAIFRLKEHVDRLFNSAHVILLDLPFSREEITEVCQEILRINQLKEGYIRPLVFMGDGAMGLAAQNNTRVAVAAWTWGAYLGEEGLKKGIRAKISSFTRHHVNAGMVKAKLCGQYVNSIMAKREAMIAGYDEAIMLDAQGKVAEASGENIFIVKDNIIKTPPTSISLLPGITRDSAITIARNLDYQISEEGITRDELYIADEVFMTGTAAEITPVREVDDRKIGKGKPGPVTNTIQDTFFKAVKGQTEKYRHWLTYL